MSKKDYERAARLAQSWAGNTDAPIVVQAYVDLFHDDGNPRFDEARFRAACVPGANVKARKVRS
jgi:hypothetical protein